METVSFYIDETKFEKDGRKYLGLSLVLIKNDENISLIKNKLEALKEELASDQFLGHDEDDRLLHFTEDSMEIKPKVIELIRELPIKGYIAFDHLEEPTNFKALYLRILDKLLFRRIQKNNDCKINIYYEEQSEIKRIDVQSVLDNILEEFPDTNYSLTKATKENILICLPDYVLGVFRDTSKIPFHDFMRRNYDKFSTKIRLIVDMENNKFYSKTNPYPIN